MLSTPASNKFPLVVSGGGDGPSGSIDAFVRELSQADTRNKVQDWLTAGTGSSEVSTDVQQQLQQLHLQQQQQQQEGLEPQTSSTLQQQQQQLEPGTQTTSAAAAMAAVAAVAAAAAAAGRHDSDVCTAEDSPFFRLLPPTFSSGSVELGVFSKAAAAGSQPAATAAAVAAGGARTGAGFGATLPSFMDPK
jgi:cystathionine beta-lyase/cystathionine gamma-synthase